MDKKEALQILNSELAKVRSRTYAELSELVGKDPIWAEVTTPTGRRYQTKCVVVWDSGKGGDVRVLGSVDDGGWRAFFPVTMDFIKAPSGTFVGE